jgi:tetratricopeptide (TPR) repeat protein
MFMMKRTWYLYDFALYGEALLWAARALQFAPAQPRFWHFASMIAWTEVKQRWKRRHRNYKLPDCEEEQPFLPVFEVLSATERPLYLTIEAHRREWEGKLDEAQSHYEDACRHNRWGNNEQRDLQRFLKKHDRKRKPGPLMPPEGFEKLRRFGLRVKAHEQADLLRRTADVFERQGKLLDARDALQDLYLFDPCDAEVFQRAKAIERSPMGQVQMMAKFQHQQQEYRGKAQIFGKFAGTYPGVAPNLKGPLNVINLNHARLNLS